MKKILCWLSITVLVITIIYGGITYFCNECCWNSIFNSSHGMLNALFSGLAFIGVIATLYWQKNDSDKKSFESNLYKQIEFFLQLVENLSYTNQDGAYPYEGKGREIFEWFYEKKKYDYSKDSTLGLKEKLKDNPRYLYSGSEIKVFESYLNYLFNIYEYIDKAQIEQVKKQDYADQLTALLSKYELLLIFYYVESLQERLDKRKYERLRALCIKYGLFQNMNKAYLADLNHVNLIDIKAYNKQSNENI